MAGLDREELFIERKCGINFSYVLKENSLFQTTEYKVQQSRTGGCLLKSTKSMYNGEIQLYYMPGTCRSFSQVAAEARGDGIKRAVRSLLEGIREVADNGFLSCHKIDISQDKIFVDLATYQVRLAYLPIEPPLFEDEAVFEKELRTELLDVLSRRTDRNTPAIRDLTDVLENGALSLREAEAYMRGIYDQRAEENSRRDQAETAILGTMYIISMNGPQRVELKVDKNDFVIGKKISEVDGAVTFSRRISRVHCKVSRRESGYTVTDMGSSNGTFVNRERLTVQQPYSVKNGDILRLADSDFQIIIR